MMKLKKKSIKNRTKKQPESTRVNLTNSRPKSLDRDNPIERKLKQIMKFNSQST